MEQEDEMSTPIQQIQENIQNTEEPIQMPQVATQEIQNRVRNQIYNTKPEPVEAVKHIKNVDTAKHVDQQMNFDKLQKEVFYLTILSFLIFNPYSQNLLSLYVPSLFVENKPLFMSTILSCLTLSILFITIQNLKLSVSF